MHITLDEFVTNAYDNYNDHLCNFRHKIHNILVLFLQDKYT